MRLAAGAIDKATKGVKAFDLPASWGQTGGLTFAIAFKMFGHELPAYAGNASSGSKMTQVDMDKRHVMIRLKRHVSELRVWVPEHLVGNPSTVDHVPDFKAATALWMANTAPRVMKTAEQKTAMTAFLLDVEAGVKGCTATSGAQKPYVLFEDCCRPKPLQALASGALDADARDMDEDKDDVGDMDAGDASDMDAGDAGGMDAGDAGSRGSSGSTVDVWSHYEESDEDDGPEHDDETAAAWRRDRLRASLQWEDMRVKLSRALDAAGVITIPVADTSGSMSGVPMRVSKALGSLLATANSHPAYKNKVLSFEEKCQTTTLDTSSCKDPHAQQRSIMKQMNAVPWGGSTDLESVFAEVARMETERLETASEEEARVKTVVIVISDMEVPP